MQIWGCLVLVRYSGDKSKQRWGCLVLVIFSGETSKQFFVCFSHTRGLQDDTLSMLKYWSH